MRGGRSWSYGAGGRADAQHESPRKIFQRRARATPPRALRSRTRADPWGTVLACSRGYESDTALDLALARARARGGVLVEARSVVVGLVVGVVARSRRAGRRDRRRGGPADLCHEMHAVPRRERPRRRPRIRFAHAQASQL